MSQLAETILSIARNLPEGRLLSPKEFLHLAPRASVDQTLTRLTRQGKLLRVGRGTYAAPVHGRFGTRSPSTRAVVEAIEASSGELVVANGAAAANTLGLTTQTPIQEVFLTSGPSRTLRLGNRTVEIRHGKRWQFTLGKQPAGMAIRALSWLGPEQAPAALKILRQKLPQAEWEALCAARSELPSWMARAVSKVSDHG